MTDIRVLLVVSAVFGISCTWSMPVGTTNRTESATPSTVNCTNCTTTGRHRRHDAIGYLQRFGHVRRRNGTSADDVDDASFVRGLKSLQRIAGLKPTGVLDAETEKLFNRSRCGVPDVDYSNETSSGRRRRRRYALSGYSWPSSKRSLLYAIGSTTSQAITPQTVNSRIQQAFQQWTNVIPSSRLTINAATSGQTADLKINFYSGNHGDGNPFDGPLGVLAHTFFPSTGLFAGQIHFDNAELWTDGISDPQQSNSRAIYFYQVALHEFGHSLGLGHSSDPKAVMAPYYSYNSSVALTADDIQGIQALYGSLTSPCASNPCQNGGTCNAVGSGYTCACPTGWTGSTCATRVANPCAVSPCQNGGTCNAVGSGYTCTCPTGWTGSTCTTSVTNPCASSPCLNGGICNTVGSGYTCTCPTGWTGSTCTTKVTDPCAINPCQNGGTCNAIGSDYFCTCPTGWTGSTCTTNVTNPCASSPCQNGGSCYALGSRFFVCSCSSGWTGGTCTDPYSNPCLSSPCKNGGQCLSFGNYFTCICSRGWSGQTCKTSRRVW